ncbi:MAG: type VI secretion system tip protein VgrG [Chitinivibrionales bacterium]|nr:type VI secretion system tip protein VgrG [Chitinivibrionales bacterium]MBD3394422.1 type VI secretion system tip protein VgrG [Chitinivibrionales bacterium]
MAARKANQAQFLFRCGTLEPATFAVAECRGRDSISAPYEFVITLASASSTVKHEDAVNKQATLYLLRDGEYYPYSGVVSEFAFVDRSTDFSTYRVRLAPRLWLLSLNVQTRIFQKMSVDAIVEQVLGDAGLDGYATFDLQASYPEREYVVQYQESDLDFISRLMERAGIWYLFKEPPVVPEETDDVGAESMIISDRPDSFGHIGGESSVVFRSHSGLREGFEREDRESIFKASFERRVVAKHVRVKNYNYRTPEVDVSSGAAVQSGDAGTVYLYGGDSADTDQAQAAAGVVAGQIASGQAGLAGTGNCRGFRAGMRFTLKEHFRDDCNDTFLIREVLHTGKHATPPGGEELFTYANEFAALPSSQVETFRPAAKTPVPRVNGLIPAHIEANGSDYAGIDDTGRYKVRMPFDLSGTPNAEGSKYVRLAQPYSGANYGMHFPSHEGAEMLVACIDGDPDKPVGVGTVPDANTVSPVVSANKEQAVIRTAGNNEILLDDTDGKQKVRLTTSAKNAAELDDENKRVYLQTSDGNTLVLDDRNEKASWNAKDHTVTMSYAGGEQGVVISTGGGHVVKIDDTNKRVTIQTKGGHAVDLDDNGRKITLADGSGKSTVTLDGNKGLILDTKGKISIAATRDIEMRGANIKMSTTSGKIEAKAAQDLNLSGMKISEKATMDFNMEGMNVNTKAQMNAKTEANLGIDIKSNLQAKVSGTMAEVSGSAVTTVKGGVVMIN